MGGTKATGKTIGEVEKLTGIPKRKLKYYIERNMMRPSQRAESRYWLYSAEDIRTVQMISLYQNLGCPDEQIRAFLANSPVRWQEELKQQIVRLTAKRDRMDDQLFLAEFLLYTNRLHTQNGMPDPTALSFDSAGNVVLDGRPLVWKTGEKEAVCRFLLDLFSDEEGESPLLQLGLLTDMRPDDPMVQEQMERLCSAVSQRRALPPARLLLTLRLASALNGVMLALDALRGIDGFTRFITAAMEVYCEQQKYM